MKPTGIKIFAYFAAALMLVSILSAGALAASDNGMNGIDGDETTEAEESDDNNESGIQQQDRDRDMVNADEDAPRVQKANTVRNKVQAIKTAQTNYKDAKDNFAKIRANDKNLDSEEALQAAKDYLNATIDRMVDIIENNENIDDDYIDELEDEREELADASTRKELAESARDINKIWKDARKEQVVDAAKNVNNKMGSALKTSNTVIVRLENEIQRMKDNGEDVEELEKMLDEYKELVTEAEENYEEARNRFRKGDAEYGETLRYMNEAGHSIRESNLVLKDLLKELKQHREGVVHFSGTGTLEAEGEGTAVLSGNLTLSFSATDAKLVIKDMAGDAVIDTDDADYESSNVDSGNSTNNNRAFVYHDIIGEVSIEGSRLTVMIHGDDITLTAEGTGSAVLAGEGSYTVTGNGEDAEGDWAERHYDDEEDEDENEDDVDDESTESEYEEEENDDSGDEDSDDDDDSDETEDDENDDVEDNEQSS